MPSTSGIHPSRAEERTVARPSLERAPTRAPSSADLRVVQLRVGPYTPVPYLQILECTAMPVHESFGQTVCAAPSMTA